MNALEPLTDDELRTLCREALVNQPTDAQMANPLCRTAIVYRCKARLARWAKSKPKQPDFKTRAAGN